MPRSPRLISPIHPYHVSVRCINKEFFPLPLPEVWDIFEQQLYFAKHAFGLRIHVFVLMGNHFHLLVSAPNGNLSAAMSYFLRESSREISRRSGHINRTFADRFHASMISNYHYFMHAYKYVYRNPVTAGVVDRPENYRFSSLFGLLGKGPLGLPMEEDTILFDDVEGTLSWLNVAPDSVALDLVRRALKKNTFAFTTAKNFKDQIEFLEQQFL